MPRATVVIPTLDHGPLLRHALASALGQTVADLEVFVVGDGVPDVTRAIVAEVASDRRVRFFDNPKAPSRGEILRHAALQEARGEIVCYLSDDDLWLPDHVATMLDLLTDADFAHALPLRVNAGGDLGFYIVNLALAADRALILSGTNRVPLSCGAHTRALYRRLPHGWRTTPAGTPTDLYMWQQILGQPECRAASGTRPTVLNFPSPQRADWTAADRLAELVRWSAGIADPAWRERFFGDVFDALVLDHAAESVRFRAHIAALEREIGAVYAAVSVPLRAHISDLEGEIDAIYGTRKWRLLARLGAMKAAVRRRGDR